MIQVVEKTVKILLFLSESNQDLSAIEISKETGINRGTVYRIINTLKTSGFIQDGIKDHTYMIGPAAYRIGMAYKRHIDEDQYIRNILINFAKDSNLNIGFAILEGINIISIHEIDQYSNVRFYDEGTEYPFNMGAYGKAIGAFFFKDKPIEEYWDRLYIKAKNPNVPKNIEELNAAYDDVRKNGYSISRGENVPGTLGIGIPVFDHKGYIIGAISIVGIEASIPSEMLPGIIKAGKNIAEKISLLNI